MNSYKLDCEAQHGQSGSPVYNLHGNLIGVLWGKSEDDSDAPYSLFASISPRIREALFKAKLEGLQVSAP